MSHLPYENPEDERIPWPKVVCTLLPIAISAAGIAPIGLAAPIGGLQAAVTIPRSGLLIALYWTLLLTIAGYALYTSSNRRASLLIAILWAVSLLNLGGCAFELIELERDLG
jgi:hypothetical protein